MKIPITMIRATTIPATMLRTTLILLALAVCGSTPLRADFTYIFQGTDGSLVEFDRDALFGPFANLVLYNSDLQRCQYNGQNCVGIVIAGSRADPNVGIHDLLAFGSGAADASRLPDQAITRTGSAWTLPGSPIEGRLMVYERDPNSLFEYFFKDVTGEKTFRYYTDRLITAERAFADGRSDLCSAGLPQGCEGGDFLAGIYGLDAVRFPGMLPFYFPQFAFTTLGVHYTDSLSPEGGVLTVRSVRNPFASQGPGSGGGDPGTDPEPVPEPSTMAMVGLAGAAALWMRRRATP